MLASLPSCTPLTRASYAKPLPPLSMSGTPTPDADSLEGIVIPAEEWVRDLNVVTTPVCDVTAAAIDPMTMNAVATMTAELARKSPKPGAASPASSQSSAPSQNLRTLAIACDAEHAAITVDGKAFPAEQIYASVRSLADGSRVLLVQGVARATGSLLLASVAFDGPSETSALTTAAFAVANVKPYLTAADQVIIVPATRTNTTELFLLRRGTLPESGVYLSGPSASESNGQMSILAARFVVGT